MVPTSIVPVIAVPVVAPTDASLNGKVFSPDGGNAIEIFGVCTAGTGRLYLLRNLGPDTSTEWYLVDDDAQDLKSIHVDSTAPTAIPGYFSGIWLTGDLYRGGTARYVVLVSTGGGQPTLSHLYAAARAI